MKLKVSDLKTTETITINGEEAWLETIYTDFPVPQGRTKPLITGTLQITPEAGTVVVQGSLLYAPILNCSRCADDIAWPLKLNLSVRYLPEEFQDLKSEKNLSRADLEAYYIAAGQVDLEALINDSIQTAIPTFIDANAYAETGHQCQIILSSSEKDAAAAEQGGASSVFSSPFAALKDLKLKN